MALGGAAQVAAAHCPNERTLDPAVCSYNRPTYAPASCIKAFTPQCSPVSSLVAEESRWKETGSVWDALLQKTASYQMAGLPDQRIHQKTTQSSTHHRGQSQASQVRAIWSHMPHAGQQNVKESVVWGGRRSQLPGTTKEALGRRHTEVVRRDTTTGGVV